MNCQKHLFSLPEDHHYLNCAYLSPLLKTVEEAGIKGIAQKRVPWELPPESFFTDSNKLRGLFAKFINARAPEQIALLPSTSYGLSTVARNLPRNGHKKIIVAGEQFPSNVYPWKRFCKEHGGVIHVVAAPETVEGRGAQWNERVLEAIDSRTLMVALSHNHWTDGTLFDIKSIAARAREVGAYFVMDGTQSVGALPLNIQEVKPDALICAGYKWLMGPYSIGFGYFGPRFTNGIPLEEGWLVRKDSEDFSALVNYQDEYQPGAIRFDVGERSNFILVPMMMEALVNLLKWTPTSVQDYCKEISCELLGELPELGYQIEDPDWRAHHLFGIRLPAHVQVDHLEKKLDERHIHISIRGTAIRVSPNVYNDHADIQALVDVLKEEAKINSNEY